MNFLRKIGFGNKRSEARIIISPPLKCLCSSSGINQEGLLAFITDISKSGVLLSVNQYGFVIGGDVELTLQLQSSTQPIILHGKIVRIRKGAQEWSALAIKFDKKDERNAEMLLAYIKKRN
ncbi:MAG: PilZ domain-containing protein [Candidatus Omnitrophica bacterium]|nr:PilZ domain-containing protein [Candidatus Omnitrophota bacterium]